MASGSLFFGVAGVTAVTLAPPNLALLSYRHLDSATSEG
jgi:hypothetical protein